jgi:hypothetical protein
MFFPDMGVGGPASKNAIVDAYKLRHSIKRGLLPIMWVHLLGLPIEAK